MTWGLGGNGAGWPECLTLPSHGTLFPNQIRVPVDLPPLGASLWISPARPSVAPAEEDSGGYLSGPTSRLLCLAGRRRTLCRPCLLSQGNMSTTDHGSLGPGTRSPQKRRQPLACCPVSIVERDWARWEASAGPRAPLRCGGPLCSVALCFEDFHLFAAEIACTRQGPAAFRAQGQSGRPLLGCLCLGPGTRFCPGWLEGVS